MTEIPDDVVGVRVPGGEYRIEEYENRILRNAVYAREGTTSVHPIAAFIGAQRGMGVSVADFFQLLRSSIEDGPVLAECTIELHSDLIAGVEYSISGQVSDVRHKRGAAFGRFDLITAEFSLADDSGVVASVTNVYAIRRGNDD